MEYKLGLDIGVASVGWGIINLDGDIIDAGVRLFEEGNKKGNVERRNKRSSRRLLRRRKHRVERMKKSLLESGYIGDKNFEYNYPKDTTPYHIRVKGLQEKLSNNELAAALLNIAKKRGTPDYKIESTQDDKEGTKVNLKRNEILLENRFICELQLERFIKKEITLGGKAVRGHHNMFKTKEYIREVNAIFDTQTKLGMEIKEEFRKEVIEIIEGRRKYYEGPGGYSPYGWDSPAEWMEKLLGRCTYEPTKIRAPKHSYKAELFNLLNDLNNLTLRREEEKLTRNEKEKIIKLALGKGDLTLKKITTTLNLDESDITGYRIDEKKKPIFTKFTAIKKLNSIVEIKEDEKIEKIIEILTYYQEPDDKLQELLKILPNVEKEKLEELSLLNYTGSHSLSLYTMDIILEDLFDGSENQQALFTRAGKTPYKMKFEKGKKIPKNYLDEWILSSTVKRSMGQAINIINAVEKKHGTPKEIIIELAREKNSEDKKNFIDKMQKQNKGINDKIKEIMEQRGNRVSFEALKLWDMQDGNCVYSGDKISIEALFHDPTGYEVDHIIPRSVSFDDSISNKVLVKYSENQKKGSMTPYNYFKSGKSNKSYEEFKSWVKAQKFDKKKRENLLFEGDITKYTTKFINRNLVDTRYATSELMNLLKVYYKDQEKQVKIKSINGGFTNQIRKMWKFPKNREVSHFHHAEDALILLTAESILNKFKNVEIFHHEDGTKERYNTITGEILEKDYFKKQFNPTYGEKVKSFDNYKVSYQIDKGVNKMFTKEKLYGTRYYENIDKKGNKSLIEYKIEKKDKLYEKDNKDIVKFFSEEKESKKLLMYKHDRKTFEKIRDIVVEYQNIDKSNNPLYLYYQEHGMVRKYSKRGNGPFIKSFKHISGKRKNKGLDVSHLFSDKPQNKSVYKEEVYCQRVDIYKGVKGYKFARIPYMMYMDNGSYYELDKKLYNEELLSRKIGEGDKFIYSLYRGNIISIDGEIFKVTGFGAKTSNSIECNFIDKNAEAYRKKLLEIYKELEEDKHHRPIYQKVNNLEECGLINNSEAKSYLRNKKIEKRWRLTPTISLRTEEFIKFNVDILGNRHVIKEEKFIDKIKKINFTKN